MWGNTRYHLSITSRLVPWTKHIVSGLLCICSSTHFLRDPTDADAHINERTLNLMNPRTYTLPLWAPPKNWVRPTNLEIDEVATGVLLLTSTSPTIEKIAPLNHRINPGKYDDPCQIGELNPDEQVLSQGTQPIKLCSVRCNSLMTHTLRLDNEFGNDIRPM
jgi:hypothetical protein